MSYLSIHSNIRSCKKSLHIITYHYSFFFHYPFDHSTFCHCMYTTAVYAMYFMLFDSICPAIDTIYIYMYVCETNKAHQI